MALSDIDRSRVTELAMSRGVDVAEALAEAEKLTAGNAPSGQTEASASDSDHPIAERMLVGFLPFVTVHEFRTIWRRLEERVEDDEMLTGDWLKLHGSTGGVSAPNEDSGGQAA